jgi:hypothetical protein
VRFQSIPLIVNDTTGPRNRTQAFAMPVHRKTSNVGSTISALFDKDQTYLLKSLHLLEKFGINPKHNDDHQRLKCPENENVRTHF